jgi:signal transduction histidine kinase
VRVMLNDPLVQAAIVGTFANASGAIVALLLWNQLRGERYLLFWGLFWTLGSLRWALHIPGLEVPWWRMVEWGAMVPLMFFFVVLGAYDLLPARPWRNRTVVVATAAIMLAYGVASNASGFPVQMGYGLAAAAYLFSAACNFRAYRATRLSGHAIAAGAFLGWGLYFIFGLTAYGREITRSVIAPLFNFLVAISLVTIAFQRRGRLLEESSAELRAAAQQVRELYVRLASVEDDERRALHAELHDRVGANLSALRLEIDVVDALLARGDEAGARREIASAREIAVETMAMARDVMAELRPPALDDYGLAAALRTFAEAQSPRLHLPIEVEGADLSPRPSAGVEGALFRIAQEAVANAARHARARRVSVRVESDGDRVILTVEDDGEGFDPAAPSAGPDHWGLKNMGERARAAGGTLRIESAPGSGTRVMAEAPLESA